MSENARPLDEFIARMPKVELHVHLEGSLSADTLCELSRAKGRGEQEARAWFEQIRQRHFRYGNFLGFIEAYKFVARHLDTPADYALAAARLVEDLARQNIRYAEITLSAGVVLWKEQRLEPAFEAAARAASEAGARHGVHVNWIFDAVRHFGPEPVREILRVAARYREHGVVAFGIGGDEQRGSAELFVDLYREARDLGLHTTAHAGETAGPESVRAAVQLLGAERIGHGVTAAKDPAVMALLGERGVALEVCITSNLATGVLGEASNHPLPRFLAEGVRVTLNTDDPGLFGTTLGQEFSLAARTFGFAREQLAVFTANAVDAAFLGEGQKAELRKLL